MPMHQYFVNIISVVHSFSQSHLNTQISYLLGVVPNHGQKLNQIRFSPSDFKLKHTTHADSWECESRLGPWWIVTTDSYETLGNRCEYGGSSEMTFKLDVPCQFVVLQQQLRSLYRSDKLDALFCTFICSFKRKQIWQH